MNGARLSRYLFSKCLRAEGASVLFLTPQTNACCYFFSTSNLFRQSDYPPNSSITPTFVNNRNPRNLEKLRIGEKPDGWILDKEGRSFWNKITLEVSSRHTSASVVHHQGQIPITASTQEWCIKKFLYSTNDASAAKLIGEVLAQRCLQAGIYEVACFFPEKDRQKERVTLFLSAVEAGGVALTEPDQVPTDWYIHDYQMPERPWEVHEDVDDSFTVSRKLRDFKVRRKQYPKAGIKHKFFKDILVSSKLLIDKE